MLIVLLLHIQVHPSKTEKALERSDTWGPLLWHMSSYRHQDNPHSPSSSSPNTHLLISSADMATVYCTSFLIYPSAKSTLGVN